MRSLSLHWRHGKLITAWGRSPKRLLWAPQILKSSRTRWPKPRTNFHSMMVKSNWLWINKFHKGKCSKLSPNRRLNKKDGLARYGDCRVKYKTVFFIEAGPWLQHGYMWKSWDQVTSLTLSQCTLAGPVYIGMPLECHWLIQCTLGYHWATQGILAGYTGTPLEKLSWNSPHWNATGETLTFAAYTGTPLEGLWQPTQAPTHIVKHAE